MARAWLSVAGNRVNGTNNPVDIDGGIISQQAGPTIVAGWWFDPLRVPQCFDASYPSRLTFLVTRAAGAVDDAGFVEFRTHFAIAREGVFIPGVTLTNVWKPPTGWLVKIPALVEMLNAGGPAFPAHTFEAGDVIGFTTVRQGTSGSDDYTNPIIFPGQATIEYTTRCPKVCC